MRGLEEGRLGEVASECPELDSKEADTNSNHERQKRRSSTCESRWRGVFFSRSRLARIYAAFVLEQLQHQRSLRPRTSNAEPEAARVWANAGVKKSQEFLQRNSDGGGGGNSLVDRFDPGFQEMWGKVGVMREDEYS